MSCKGFHLFHKWSNWSEPKQKINVYHTVKYGIPIDNTERKVVHLIQERTCQRCGLVQQEELEV